MTSVLLFCGMGVCGKGVRALFCCLVGRLRGEGGVPGRVPRTVPGAHLDPCDGAAHGVPGSVSPAVSACRRRVQLHHTRAPACVLHLRCVCVCVCVRACLQMQRYAVCISVIRKYFFCGIDVVCLGLRGVMRATSCLVYFIFSVTLNGQTQRMNVGCLCIFRHSS